MAPKKKQRILTVIATAIVLSAVVGGLSGVIASVLTNRSIDTYLQTLSQDTQFFSLSEVKPRPLPGTYEESLDRIFEVAAPATAVVRAMTEDESSAAGWIRQDETIATGAVVTSDGWMLFHKSAFDAFSLPESQADIWVRSERYTIEEIVEDPLTDAIMVRVDARDLPSVAFGSTIDMTGGEILFVAPGEAVVTPTMLMNVFAFVPELILPAERFIDHWQIDVEPNHASVLFNSSAELVGVHGKDETIPMHQLVGFVQATFRGQVEKRAAIGVHSLDIGSVINIDERVSGGVQQGALIIAPNARTEAVLSGGPADEAGLQAGDIVTSIQGVAIKQGMSLAELLAQFSVNESIRVQIERNGESLELTLILGSFEQMNY